MTIRIGALGVLFMVAACAGNTPDDAALAALDISGATRPALDFSPDRFSYQVDVPLLQDTAIITATAVAPEAVTIEVVCPDGTSMELGSGEPSAPIALALGPNRIDVVATHASGTQHVYTLTLRRAAAISQQYAYGKASNTGAGDWFGERVALSATGTTLAVSAHQESSAATGINGNETDDSAVDSGAVYIFERVAESWLQTAYIKASNTGAGDHFGWSLALSDDGNTLAVGAYGESSAATGINGNAADDSATESGAVYVFERDGGQWQQTAYIKAANTGAGDWFGASVALSGSGDLLVVGASNEASAATGINGNDADNSAANSGAFYVFSLTNGQWQQDAYIKASNTGAGDHLGWSVALSSAGDTLAVSAYTEASAAVGTGGDENDNNAANSGAVYVYTRIDGQWQQDAYIKASNTGAGDWFGWRVALSGAGTTLAVCARLEDSAGAGIDGAVNNDDSMDSGALYVFEHAQGQWAEQAYVKASNTGVDDRFGSSVALSFDGNTMAVGAYREGSGANGFDGDQNDDSVPRSGAVYLFARAGGQWQQNAYVKALTSDANDAFGYSVALSSPGDILIAGAFAEDSAATGMYGAQDDNSAGNSGAVYIFY